jgi:WD40 repeat protein
VVDDPAVRAVRELDVCRPNVVALARAASIAAVVEPALLRRLRLGLPASAVGGRTMDSGVEADLWFSRLAHVATSGQLTLRPPVAELLRRDLREPRHQALARTARRIVAEAHRRHPDMLRLEERIIWSAILGDDEDVGRALDRALATVRLGPDRATTVVRWVSQARRRLPASVFDHPAGRRLMAAVALHTDRIVPAQLLAANRFSDSLGDMAPTGLPLRDVAVELAAGGVRFAERDHPGAPRLVLPNTRPLVLEATWEDERGAEHTAVILAEPGSTTALPGLAGALVLRTITGRRFRVSATYRRRVVVAVFGVPAWRGTPSLAERIAALLDEPAVTVEVIEEPSDLSARPEVLVFDPRLEPRPPSLDTVAAAFVRAAVRAHDPSTGERPPGVLVAVRREGEVTGDLTSDPVLSPFQAEGMRIISAAGTTGSPFEAVQEEGGVEASIAEAVLAVLRHDERLYRLDPASARTMLNSLALAFHMRYFYRDEVAGEAAERQLFDLAGDPDGVVEATFRHVQTLCEWLFAGPIEDYLRTGQDPTQGAPPGERANYPEERRDSTGRRIYDVGWSPYGEGWPSFHAYLSWFVEQWHHYATLLRDRLGPRTMVDGLAVQPDMLESCRLALGIDGLPPGQDRLMAPSRYRPDEPPDVLFAVERAALPNLVSALAAPVLAAVAAAAGSAPPATAVRSLTGHQDGVTAVAFGPDGLLASAGDDGEIRLWDPGTGDSRAIPIGHRGPATAVAFGPDGLLASAGEDGYILLWDPATDESAGVLVGHTGGVTGVAFSPEGGLLASSGSDGTVRLWDTTKGEMTKVLTGHIGRATAVAFPAGGRLVTSAGEDGTLRLWGASTWQATTLQPSHRGAVTAVAFASDGRLLASAGADATVRLWDTGVGASSGEPLVGHEGAVTGAAFAPGGGLLVSSGTDGSLRLWVPARSAAVGEPLRGHEGAATAVAFGPDGSTFASAGADRTVRLWRLTASVAPPGR